MKKILIVFILTLFIKPAISQRIELIGMAGSSHFMGDLGGKLSVGSNDISDIDFMATRYAVGGGLRIKFGNSIGVRFQGIYARLAGSDENTDYWTRKERNLSFFTPLIEGDFLLEFYLGTQKRFYTYVGAGYMYFNPKTKIGSTKYALQPLGTEGQNYLPSKSPYALTGMVIPFGFGYKLAEVGQSTSLFLEIAARKTFTDYIDDVSGNYADNTQIVANSGAVAGQLANRSTGTINSTYSNEGNIRGNPDNNDNYFFLLLTLNKSFGRSSNRGFGSGRSSGKKWKIFNKKKCPTF